MPSNSTYDARRRGGAAGFGGDHRMRGAGEMVHTVGCYRLATQCPPRRIPGPCDDAACVPCSCPPRPPCPKPESCEELLESVVASETDIARSLDAEGEKFRRIVESADDLDALLAANGAVNRALEDALVKEQALYRELQRIVEICGACVPKPKDARSPGIEDPSAFPGYKA